MDESFYELLLNEEIKELVIDLYEQDDIEEDVDCLICLEKIDNYQEGKLLCGCNNKFHINCLQSWINQNYNCPICRKGPNIQSNNQNNNDYIIEFMNYFDNNNQVVPIENLDSITRRQEINRLRINRNNNMKYIQIIGLVLCCIIIFYVLTEQHSISNN